MTLGWRAWPDRGAETILGQRGWQTAWPASFEGIDAFCIRTAEDKQEDFSPRLRSMLQQGCMDWGDLPRENFHGCIEYKWRLVGADYQDKIERLASQMKFRLGEGGGTAFYLLGVHDSGSAAGLSPKEHADTVLVLMTVAAAMGNVLLLEAMSPRRRGGKRCSAWRVEAKRAALQQVSDTLHTAC
eukprot:CAMPEP_0171097420 /NCGR_PEP_ID=MMETSP0766_2-20121228/47532_1 /TAXON_ID=439317 /ORGANISM="Gambierdiscus australes, Strain CAWD 149" /LENGTH=184 /DNA_ID=CAMNT_0011556611 /DNA_START=42 /DNA_END=596 /DNA_ORIENTATION=-